MFVCLSMTPQLHSHSHDKLIKLLLDCIIQKLHILQIPPRIINVITHFGWSKNNSTALQNYGCFSSSFSPAIGKGGDLKHLYGKVYNWIFYEAHKLPETHTQITQLNVNLV